MKEFLWQHPSFSACEELVQQVAFKTVLGQHLDTNGQLYVLRQQQQMLLHELQQGGTRAEEAVRNLAAVARSRQNAAARLKTSHYSFWLPTALGTPAASCWRHAVSRTKPRAMVVGRPQLLICICVHSQINTRVKLSAVLDLCMQISVLVKFLLQGCGTVASTTQFF